MAGERNEFFFAMNVTDEQRFFDLAMKTISGQATNAEKGELDSLIQQQPELKAELERFQKEARIAREVAPLLDAAESSAGEFPRYARERLQTKVRESLAERKSQAGGRWNWRWVLGLATGAAAAVVLLITVPMFRTSSGPVIELAMLDMAGGTRGSGTDDLALLQATWKGTPVQTFSNLGELETWQNNWRTKSNGNVAKIIYDPSAGEVKVSGYSKGRFFEKTFPVEPDLAATLRSADTFVREQGF